MATITNLSVVCADGNGLSKAERDTSNSLIFPSTAITKMEITGTGFSSSDAVSFSADNLAFAIVEQKFVDSTSIEAYVVVAETNSTSSTTADVTATVESDNSSGSLTKKDVLVFVHVGM